MHELFFPKNVLINIIKTSDDLRSHYNKLSLLYDGGIKVIKYQCLNADPRLHWYLLDIHKQDLILACFL